jgi:hypothetical protein
VGCPALDEVVGGRGGGYPARRVRLGLWSKEGVPHKGWRLAFVDDLSEANHVCEMCNNERIRYVHHVEHEEYGWLEVGCVCAENLTQDRAQPRAAERTLRNRAARREKWLSQPWRLSRRGGFYLRREGVVFVVTSFPGVGWKAYLCTDRTTWKGGKRVYETQEQAKMALFDVRWPPRERLRKSNGSR